MVQKLGLVKAAQALTRYVATWALDAELAALIHTLSTDKSPAVRFQIASGLGSLYNRDREMFWQIGQSMLDGENATAVLAALAQAAGQAYIARQEPQKVIGYLKQLLKRQLPKKRPEDLLKAAIDSLSYLYIYLNEPSANRLLQTLEKSSIRYRKHLHAVAQSASYYLDYKIEETDSQASSMRNRARELEMRILQAIDEGLQQLERKPATKDRRTIANRRSMVKDFLVSVDSLVSRLHTIVRANSELAPSEKKSLSEGAVGRFFNESIDLWDALVNAESEYRRPIGPSTAHNLLESFNRVLPVNPDRVLKLVWLLITGRYTFGYQFDGMAIAEFVKFTDKILADYKDLLSNDTNVVRFSEVLDVFVSAGWPQATAIVLQLDAAVR